MGARILRFVTNARLHNSSLAANLQARVIEKAKEPKADGESFPRRLENYIVWLCIAWIIFS